MSTGTLTAIALSAALSGGPATDLRNALSDCDSLPSLSQQTTRYLSLYNVPAHERDTVASVCSLALNLVSRTASIYQPQRISDSLLRVDLNAYGIPTVVWEAMVSQAEPYWHLRNQAIDPKSKKVATVYTDGGWVGIDDAAKLRSLTVSGGAIVRADWFLAKALTTVDGFYYELSGLVGNVNDVYRSLGIDFIATEKLSTESWAVLIRSGITKKARRVRRRQGAAGGAWKTEDTQGESPTQDPIRVPLDTAHEASEHVVARLNGLPLFILANGKGELVKTAPDTVAKDETDSHANGGILAPALSCLACHTQNALQTVSDDFAKLIAGDVEAYFPRYEDQQKARSYFGRNMQRQLDRDREDFADAVQLACGIRYEQIIPAAVRIYQAYVGTVTPDEAQAELTIPHCYTLRQVLGSSHDPILLALCEGLPVNRKQFEASFAEAMTLVEGWQK